MLFKEKTNLSWLYGEYIRGEITETKIFEILKDFGYDLKTRIALLECMHDNKKAAEEDKDLDFWLERLEEDVFHTGEPDFQ